VRFKGNLSFLNNPLPKEKQRVGVRQGALIRMIARRSIRKRKANSQPGNPPTSRTGLLRNFIFFSWDPGSQSVIVGPERLNLTGKTPKTLEYGGTNQTRGKNRRARYKARPYMRPALNVAMARLPELWKNAIK
jgi:hypothetical protein